MPAPDVNPYKPASSTGGEVIRRPRWIRSLVILNLILVAIPASVVALGYYLIYAEISRDLEPNSSGPVVFQIQFDGLSGRIGPMLAYFVAPNLLLLSYLVYRDRSQKTSSL